MTWLDRIVLLITGLIALYLIWEKRWSIAQAAVAPAYGVIFPMIALVILWLMGVLMIFSWAWYIMTMPSGTR